MLSDASCQKMGSKGLGWALFSPWQNIFKQRKWNSLAWSTEKQRTISDSDISPLPWLWQEGAPLPPCCGQMSVCCWMCLTTQGLAWVKCPAFVVLKLSFHLENVRSRKEMKANAEFTVDMFAEHDWLILAREVVFRIITHLIKHLILRGW